MLPSLLLALTSAHAEPPALPLPAAPLCAEEAMSGWVAAGEEPLEGPEWSERLECASEGDCLAALRALRDPRPMVVAARTLDPGGQALLAAPVRLRIELECDVSGVRATWTCDGACELAVERPTFTAPVQARR